MWNEDIVFQQSGVADQELPAAALYVVATPIGNAADLTLRALWTLSRVDAVAAEDTRTTRTLLARYGLAPPVFAAHQHNERAAANKILERLAHGERVALVTDAGTPAVSDPGGSIVLAVSRAGYRVVPVPGASSVLAALMASGAAAGPFQFLGFLPVRAKQREQLLAAAGSGVFVVLEAPHRMRATARELAAALAPARRVVICRELTKKFETIAVTAAAALPALFEQEAPRGEFVLVVDADPSAEAVEIDATTQHWLRALAAVLPAARAAAVAAKATGIPRELLYRELTTPGAGKDEAGDG